MMQIDVVTSTIKIVSRIVEACFRFANTPVFVCVYVFMRFGIHDDYDAMIHVCDVCGNEIPSGVTHRQHYTRRKRRKC